MTERIVVGVDGSPHALAALRWAIEEARLRGATVDAVAAWQFPYATDISGMAPVTTAAADLGDATTKILDHSVDDALLTTRPGVTVRRIVKEGTPAHVLVTAAEGASMLVVGSRGRGGFTGLLLGSVSQQVAHHAGCPVVIVRG